MQPTKASDAPDEKLARSCLSVCHTHQLHCDRGKTMTTRNQRNLESCRSLTRRANVVLLTFVLAALAQTTAAQQYQLSYLDGLGGNSRSNSINNRDWIAG